MAHERNGRPSVAILKTSGINCDAETQYAFETAGAQADIVHVNTLINQERSLEDYSVVVIPGGFSYGDDVASGRIMAIQLTTQLGEVLLEHTQHKKRLVVGICNGFQVLMQTGLLPFGNIATLDQMKATLTHNDSKTFESRWIHIVPQESVCSFIPITEPIRVPVAHGEGKFVTDPETLARLESSGQIIYKYCTAQGTPTMGYPDNPNGSLLAIAGICNSSGNIIGLMPHPERSLRHHDPNWRRHSTSVYGQGQIFFDKIIRYVKQF